MKPHKFSTIAAYAGSVLGAVTTLVVLLVTIQAAPEDPSLGITSPSIADESPLHTIPSDPPFSNPPTTTEAPTPPHVCVFTYDHAMDPTCTTEGETVYICVCGEEQTESIPKIDHHFAYSHTVEATCTNEGQIISACVCGLTQSEFTPKTAHQYTLDRQIAPSCTREGKRIFACVCGEEQTEFIRSDAHV